MTQTDQPPAQLKTGAVAMIDALGFAGIWKHCEIKDVIETLVEIFEVASRFSLDDSNEQHQRLINLFKQHGSAPVIQAVAVSDTFIAAIIPEADTEISPEWKSLAIHTLSVSVGSLLHAAAQNEILPLTFRGALTIGEFYWSEGVFLGPAIDECARLHQLAESASVFLSRKAFECLANSNVGNSRNSAQTPEAILKGSAPIILESYLAYPVAVPLKSGVVTTGVVCPFLLQGNHAAEQFAVFKEGLSSSFERGGSLQNDVAVQVKYRNTLELLQKIRP